MKKFFTFSMLILLFSCSETKFSTNKWSSSDAILEGTRVEMLNDLLQNHIYFGMNLKEVKELLGESDIKNTLHLKYLVEEKYGVIDPNGHLYLKLDFNENKELVQWNIIETGFKE